MKEIENFEGYFVNELGNIFSNKKSSGNVNGELRQLKIGLNLGGYPKVYLHIKGKGYTKLVHRLVAEAFIPNPENKKTVNHKNGIKTDCRAINLEWSTQSENNQHAFDTGLNVAPKGERHGLSKLTEAQVLQIRSDSRSLRIIAIDYGVSNVLIGDIKRREIWKHI